MPLTPDELDMMPSRLRLEDLHRAPTATWPPLRDYVPGPKRPRSLWRGIDGGQSVLVLQVMGQMWERWSRWGELRTEA